MVSKNAQAALEFMTTYGWAIFTIMLILGVVYYFDFDPTTYLKSQCAFGNQFECAEYRIYENGRVDLLIRNNFARPITINKITLLDTSNNLTMLTGSVYIPRGRTNITSFMVSGDSVSGRQELLLVINFSRADTNGPSHLVVGRVYSSVLPGGTNGTSILPLVGISINPTSALAGRIITVSWNNISGATASDWFGLFAPGAADAPGQYLERRYVNCATSPSGGGIVNGSCLFRVPYNVTAGIYEIRLFANNGYSRLAKSQPLTVTNLPVAPLCTPSTLDCAFQQLRTNRIRIRCENEYGQDIDEAKVEVINSTPQFSNMITADDCTAQGINGMNPHLNMRCETGNMYAGMSGQVVTVGFYLNYSFRSNSNYTYCNNFLTGTIS